VPADEADVRERIQMLVVQFIARVVVYNHAVAQHVGLGATDAQFLTLLQVHGPMTAGQLADMTRLSTGTTTSVIDRLERAGFVGRVRDKHDRRKVIVTRDEDVIANRIAPHYAAQARRLNDVLASRSAGELQVIADFLTDMIADPDPDLA
jgi:DNA-binding MarR family transcriptional regulator